MTGVYSAVEIYFTMFFIFHDIRHYQFWITNGNPKIPISPFCGNCLFPQNFHTRKLDEITVFYAEIYTLITIKCDFIISWQVNEYALNG